MTIEDLKETAALAHLSLSESELTALLPAFEQILEYFAMMQAADEDRAAFPEGLGSALTDASNNSNAVGSDFFRSDNTGSSSNTENLINNAGEKDGRFIVIPNVL